MTVITKRPRDTHLDALRGTAILLMLLDHVLDLTHSLPILRYTVTRFSMPLFFLIGGHLVRRASPRLLLVACIGIFLPLYARWIDSPNVLYWYAVGAVGLYRWREKPAALVAILIGGLALSANKWPLVHGSSYAPLSLFGLMIVGKFLPRDAFHAIPAPRFIAPLGRFPLSIYVGHVLIFETVRRVM